MSPVPPAVAAVAKPQIEDTRVERAPMGEQGGLMNPVVWCPDFREPKVRTVARGLDSGFHKVWRYRGSLPGLYFPRVEVGRYRLTTKARCGGTTAKRVEVVVVEEKTARTTIARKEFNQIERGMTQAKVRRIVGYTGTGSRYRARVYRTYDMMPFGPTQALSSTTGGLCARAGTSGTTEGARTESDTDLRPRRGAGQGCSFGVVRRAPYECS